MDPASVKARLAALGIRPSKARGQHFLVDERIAARQVEHGGVTPEDTVLEVGPGLGVLTDRLARAAKRVVAVESDRRLAEALRGRWTNVEVVPGDAVEVDLPPFDLAVANLPYQISSPLTFRLLGLPFRRASLMYQREFADRLVARPGTADYSRLTVKAYRHAETRVVESVPPSSFWPPPKVHSAIVVLEPRPAPFAVQDEERFERLVDVLFQHRRKKIGTTIAAKWRQMGLTAAPADVPWADRRVGELTPEELAALADRLG